MYPTTTCNAGKRNHEHFDLLMLVALTGHVDFLHNVHMKQPLSKYGLSLNYRNKMFYRKLIKR